MNALKNEEEAKKLFDKTEAVFLDARSKDLFEQGHIKRAKNLPWYEVDDYFMDIVKEVTNDTVIITYCDGETCDLSHELALSSKIWAFFVLN